MMVETENVIIEFDTEEERKISVRAKEAWNRLVHRVACFVEEARYQIRYFFEPDAPAFDYISVQRSEAAEAIRIILGDDPAQELVNMTPEARKDMLSTLHAAISDALGMSPCDVCFEAITPALGEHTVMTNTITINDDLVCSRPFTAETAEKVIKTLCHETYHALQWQAIVHPSKFGISKDDATIWRLNFKNYINIWQNSERYAYQPVEISAELFANGVMKRICGRGKDASF